MSLRAAFEHMSDVIAAVRPPSAELEAFVPKSTDRDGSLDSTHHGHRVFEWRVVEGSRPVSTLSMGRQSAEIRLAMRYELDRDQADLEVVIDEDLQAIIGALIDPVGFDTATSTIQAIELIGFAEVEVVYTDDSTREIAVIVGPRFTLFHQEC